METLGFWIIVLLLLLWLFRMGREYGLLNVLDALMVGCSRHIAAVLTVILLALGVYLLFR